MPITLFSPNFSATLSHLQIYCRHIDLIVSRMVIGPEFITTRKLFMQGHHLFLPTHPKTTVVANYSDALSSVRSARVITTNIFYPLLDPHASRTEKIEKLSRALTALLIPMVQASLRFERAHEYARNNLAGSPIRKFTACRTHMVSSHSFSPMAEIPNLVTAHPQKEALVRSLPP